MTAIERDLSDSASWFGAVGRHVAGHDQLQNGLPAVRSRRHHLQHPGNEVDRAQPSRGLWRSCVLTGQWLAAKRRSDRSWLLAQSHGAHAVQLPTMTDAWRNAEVSAEVVCVALEKG